MKIKVGDRVRSFDFDSRDLEGEAACYIEGTVLGIGDFGFQDCKRYEIQVEREVFAGEVKEVADERRYPPVNGTRIVSSRRGKVTDGVVCIDPEWQVWGVDADGKLVHAGVRRCAAWTQEAAEREQSEWELWAQQYIEDNPGEYPLKDSVGKTVELRVHPLGKPEEVQSFAVTVPRIVDYYGLRTDFRLSTKTEQQLFAIRDVASEHEEWQTVDDIDRHLQERRKSA